MTTEYSQAVYVLLFGEVLGISNADLAPVVVLPHVILLPAASLRMLPAARCIGVRSDVPRLVADRADEPLYGLLAPCLWERRE